jgi:hypothetical protein
MVMMMPRLTNLTLGLGVLGAILFGGNFAHAQTSEACESAISQMGYPVENHVFIRGGLLSNDRHIYGETVCEVSPRGEIRKIERDGQILAEDGIFGLGAQLLRREAEQISANRLAEARQARDQAIEAARAIYEEARQEEQRRYAERERIERSTLENLLQGLRDGVLNEAAALHFDISPDFLSEFEEDEFFSALRERREQEREAEQARIEEEARERERERARRDTQRRSDQAAAEGRRIAERLAKERVLGVPVEPEASIRGTQSFPEQELLQVGRVGIQLIHARGWACDTISAVHPFFFGGGITIRCNQFRYEYELTDRGGRWQIELK